MIQYQGAHAVPCHVSRAHFRQSLLNDIPVLSELLQFHVFHVLLGQLLRSCVLRGTRLELPVPVPVPSQCQGKLLLPPASAPCRRMETYGRAPLQASTH